MTDVLTIRQAVERCKAEGMPVTEYSLRGWIKTGVIPVRKVGQKALLYFPNLVSYLQCADGCDNAPVMPAEGGIRRVGA